MRLRRVFARQLAEALGPLRFGCCYGCAFAGNDRRMRSSARAAVRHDEEDKQRDREGKNKAGGGQGKPLFTRPVVRLTLTQPYVRMAIPAASC